MYALVAADLKGGISRQNRIPWKLPEDHKFYRHVSLSLKNPPDHLGPNVVILGRKTWETLPASARQLKDRLNVVVTSLSQQSLIDGEKADFVSRSLDEAIEWTNKKEDHGAIYIFGGSRLYEEAFKHSRFELLFYTRVMGNYECDNFVNVDWDEFEKVESRDEIKGCTDELWSWLEGNKVRTDTVEGVQYRFECYRKKLDK